MTYGLVSVATHPRESRIARVFAGGQDVSNLCFAANDVEGWADCFVRDADGHYVVVDGHVKCERLTGHVVIDFPRGLD